MGRQPLPGFRAAATEASRFADFTAMASALPARQRTVELQLQAIVAHDTQSRLPELEMPTLVIHGTADRMLPAVNGELIASLVPGAGLELLADVGHMYWWEQPRASRRPPARARPRRLAIPLRLRRLRRFQSIRSDRACLDLKT